MKFVKVKNIHGFIGYVNLDMVTYVKILVDEVYLCFSSNEYDTIKISLEEFEVNVKGELE